MYSVKSFLAPGTVSLSFPTQESMFLLTYLLIVYID